MLTTLAAAPVGVPLVIDRIAGSGFASRLARLGLYEGTGLTRLDDSVAIGPAKIVGPGGEVTLGGWLAAKVVMHRDDDRRLPLLECAPGDSGHVEGVTGHRDLEEDLAVLGVGEGDRITFLRRLPPMLYKAVVDGKERIQINEGLAAKIHGETPSGPAQFCSVGVGEAFTVRRILAGAHAGESLAALDVKPGSRLTLTQVAAGQVVHFSHKTPVVCSTRDGLRLYFQEKDAARIYVSSCALPG
ncbi:FeoA family protein [Solidesulfovibrio fructosivorans JJ]]|uniref:FeoA family protein n=1 Tax=Solidesulfovibrio fructosivorans JJ] TaxID=596151 RepID=E1JWZ2_SOLFR|nr:FeoA domain-containing protein [Solidesulfovibrio fructosivorans]EFL51196.1 FeoA family protein [Solidesulfovibrio fructosivorans JJ]]